MPVISAPPFFVQLFYQDAAGSGWSEGWWWHADDYQSALDDWNPEVLGNLFDFRKKLFTASVKGVYLRVSDATVKRDTMVAGIEVDKGQGEYAPAAGTDMLPSDDALLIRLQGTLANKPAFTLRPLRGIPEDCVLDGVYKPKPQFAGDLQAFFTQFKTKGRMVLKQPNGVASAAIDSITPLHMSQRAVGRPFGLSRGRIVRP